MKTKKTVLVTGCSAGGIGAALAEELAKQGHHVFATARYTTKIPPLLTELSNVTVIELDVTSQESVDDSVNVVREVTAKQSAGAGLDVLVNNAGSGFTMPALDVDIGMAKKIYETNVWGPLRMMQGFSDLLIAKKGRIVNVNSVGGEINTPWIAIYGSSKAALKSISETLRLELAPFGVSVVTVMMGRIKSSFHANEPAPVLPETSLYTSILDIITLWSRGEPGPQGGHVKVAVAGLMREVLADGRNGVVWTGPWAGLVKFLYYWMPTFVLDALLSKNQGLDKLPSTKERRT